MTAPATSSRGQRLPRSARRAQLLQAAQEVFVDQGYHAAAMDDIALGAGVSKPVLYQHFPGKLDLYLALLDSSCDALDQLVRDALEQAGPDNHDRVQATIDAYFTFVSAPHGAFRMVFESDLTSEPAVRARLDSVELSCAETVADVIAADTGVDDDRAMLLAVALTGMAQVSARHWQAQGVQIPRDEAANLVAMLVWRGLGSFPKVDEDLS
ncbi:MAG: TetR/AcrR family transcriptional regulator [Nostocoides sp.]